MRPNAYPDLGVPRARDGFPECTQQSSQELRPSGELTWLGMESTLVMMLLGSRRGPRSDTLAATKSGTALSEPDAVQEQRGFVHAGSRLLRELNLPTRSVKAVFGFGQHSVILGILQVHPGPGILFLQSRSTAFSQPASCPLGGCVCAQSSMSGTCSRGDLPERICWRLPLRKLGRCTPIDVCLSGCALQSVPRLVLFTWPIVADISTTRQTSTLAVRATGRLRGLAQLSSQFVPHENILDTHQ